MRGTHDFAELGGVVPGLCPADILVAVFFGGTAHGLTEDFAEIARGAETAFFADLYNALGTAGQKVGRHGQAGLCEINDGRCIDAAGKAACTLTGADIRSCGNILQGELLAAVILDKLRHQLEALCVSCVAPDDL